MFFWFKTKILANGCKIACLDGFKALNSWLPEARWSMLILQQVRGRLGGIILVGPAQKNLWEEATSWRPAQTPEPPRWLLYCERLSKSLRLRPANLWRNPDFTSKSQGNEPPCLFLPALNKPTRLPAYCSSKGWFYAHLVVHHASVFLPRISRDQRRYDLLCADVFAMASLPCEDKKSL